jgi:hypothetical protein
MLLAEEVRRVNVGDVFDRQMCQSKENFLIFLLN